MDSSAEAFVNTVNTVGVMGKGIALQFKIEFPQNYAVYRDACLKHNLQIGQLLTVADSSLLLGNRLIINFPTKTHWRLPSEYRYVEKGLQALDELITKKEIKSVALPALGCGNGGLDWLLVKEMICRYLEPLDIVIEVYEPNR